MREALAGQRRLHPFTLDVTQPALDGGDAHAEANRQFLDCLLLLLIGFLKSILAYLYTSTELVAAFLAFIQLRALTHTILYCMGRTANLTFLLVHTNSAFRHLKCLQS